MTFSQYSGTAIVPTLSRLVLALAFITAGFNKLFTDATFNAEQAERLEAVGVDLDRMTASAGPAIVLAQSPQEEQTPPPEEEEMMMAPPEDEPAPPAEQPQMPPPEESPGEKIVIKSPGQYTAKTLHGVTLLCEGAGFGRYSPYLAWLAAVTEFGGGILILVGFLSRIWGLGLAIAMGTAVYLTTWDPYISTGPFEVAQNHIPMFNRAFAQLGLGVLALSVLLAGPGPLSLDRLVFGKRGGGKSASDFAGPAGGPMAGPARGAVPERRTPPPPKPKPQEGDKPASGRPL
ncbi:MAG: DoxX family protein [Planctomycetota bacterium]|nr:DoxX family protein [Planctomycetota bacterium]